jgi:DNA-binding LytR/AlgR family response regulator
VAGSCKSVPEAFDVLQREAVDLVFLDINLPEVSGLSFARSVNSEVKIIFTTAYREYAVDGFNLQAVDYLLKPISFERLMQAVRKFQKEQVPIQRFVREDGVAEQQGCMFVRSERRMVRVNFHEIRYVESLSDYVKIHLEEGRIVTRETISNIEARLPQSAFVRIHRSYIVSMAHIDAYTHEDVQLQGTELPISRSFRSHVLARLGEAQ